MAKHKPIPRTNAEKFKDSIEPYASKGKPPLPDGKIKANQRSVKGDADAKKLNIGLHDIDFAIAYYFNEVIRPSVERNGERINVPTLYGHPERWAAVQKDGYYRDKNGKIQTPLIMFKRENVEKNRTMGSKVDATNPNNYGVFKKKYSQKEVYDRFGVLSNRKPTQELYAVLVPDYVNITYSCAVFTDYVAHMNKIVESINFASDSYWGDPEKFSFRAWIDNYDIVTEVTEGQDRLVKANFTLNMLGYIIPDSINTDVLNNRKFYSKSSVTFGLEVSGTEEELTLASGTPDSEAPARFFDAGGGGRTLANFESGLTAAELDYLKLNNVKTAASVTTSTATFSNTTLESAPTADVAVQEPYSLFINGRTVSPSNFSVSQFGSDVVATIDTGAIGFTLGSGDEVLLVGKILE